MTKLELEVSLIVMSIPTSFALSKEIRIYKNFGKRDITMVSLLPGLTELMSYISTSHRYNVYQVSLR